jgi:hypothetical protein
VQRNVSAVLVYEPVGGRPLTIARVDDQALLLRIAEAAIGEAQARAELVARADDLLGEVQREEVNRLKKVLTLLVPELNL